MRLTSLLIPLLAACCHAADEPAPPAWTPTGWYLSYHNDFMAIAKAGGVEAVFIGDSITENWNDTGKEVWKQFFAPLKAANFGIHSDRTNGVMWRIKNGEVDLHPKLVVLMIGTNNGGSAEDVALEIRKLVDEIQTRSPGTRIMLHALLPRGERPDDPQRRKIAQVNKLISAYANPNDPKRVVFLDLSATFIGPDQLISKEIMADFLHPSVKGYQIWAEALVGPVKQQLQP